MSEHQEPISAFVPRHVAASLAGIPIVIIDDAIADGRLSAERIEGKLYVDLGAVITLLVPADCQTKETGVDNPAAV
jgi:hypothetical protein